MSRRSTASPALLIILLSSVAGFAGAGRITGMVRDRDGKPLPGALVQVNRCSGAKIADLDGLRATTGDDGHFELPVAFEGAGPLQVRELFISKDGFIRYDYTKHLDVSDGAAPGIEVQLTPGELLAGDVAVPPVPTGGRSKSGRPPRLVLSVLGENFRQLHLVPAEGPFRIFVPPGDYRLELHGADVVLPKVTAPARGLKLERTFPKYTSDVATAAFDALWADMDRHYSYFALRPEVNWAALRDEYRPKAAAARDQDAFLQVLREMLANLKDMHVWIQTPKGPVGTYESASRQNWNARVVSAAVRDETTCGEFAIVGRIKPEGFGCLIITNQNRANPDYVAKAVRALEALRDAPGFIIDLRGGANGGDERLAREIAQLFASKPTLYAKSKMRSGPGHEDFGEVTERVLPAAEKPIEAPIVCLIGNRCMSSGEALVKMFDALPQTTTVGDRTRGSSGNPQPFALPGINASVWYSRWVDLLPDGTPLEGRGISPDVPVAPEPHAYETADPTWERGLAVLREKVAAAPPRRGD